MHLIHRPTSIRKIWWSFDIWHLDLWIESHMRDVDGKPNQIYTKVCRFIYWELNRSNGYTILDSKRTVTSQYHWSQWKWGIDTVLENVQLVGWHYQFYIFKVAFPISIKRTVGKRIDRNHTIKSIVSLWFHNTFN